MAINRSTKYKYPSDQPALNGRKSTQQLIDEINGTEFLFKKKNKDKISWVKHFRQKDLIECLKEHFKGPAKQDGHCQVITTMYMHLRELTKGNVDIALKLFKYWCFMDRESVIALSNDKKNGIWLKGFLSGNKTFLQDYFHINGQYSFPNVAYNFWANHSARKTAARDVGHVNAVVYHAKSNGEGYDFVENNRQQTDAQGTDDFDFLREYEPNYVLQRNAVYYDARKCLSHVIVNELSKFSDTEEVRILINLKSSSGEEAHSVSLIRFDDNLDHLEFVDGNRGIFLLPNNLVKVEDFLRNYFNQTIYESFAFSTIQNECYNNTAGLQVSPRSESMLNLSTERRNSAKEIIHRQNSGNQVPIAETDEDQERPTPGGGGI